MASTGYIRNGVYHKTKVVPLESMVIPEQSTYKLSDHARQRFDHAADILQPHGFDGQPNPKWIEANPDEAEEYGFTPRTREPEPLESDTPVHGSTPWSG